ncbi:MAG: RNA-binding protein [Candidatus Aminicenantes bacterium]|nr:RNA-binding protein [Candidatus Aminicenantes bacterium]
MNIYVGNLSWEMSEDDLRTSFSEFGEVSTISIIKDKFSGRSRGFGFVEMPNKEEAESAISGLNGKDMKGRDLRVNEARARTENRRDGGGGFGGRRY